MALFAAIFAPFCLWQVQKALRTRRIASVLWWVGVCDRRRNPLGFWVSLLYWVTGVIFTVWVVATYAYGGHPVAALLHRAI
jgi:hypothetical protein